jgi:hypothetical protein
MEWEQDTAGRRSGESEQVGIGEEVKQGSDANLMTFFIACTKAIQDEAEYIKKILSRLPFTSQTDNSC